MNVQEYKDSPPIDLRESILILAACHKFLPLWMLKHHTYVFVSSQQYLHVCMYIYRMQGRPKVNAEPIDDWKSFWLSLW